MKYTQREKDKLKFTLVNTFPSGGRCPEGADEGTKQNSPHQSKIFDFCQLPPQGEAMCLRHIINKENNHLRKNAPAGKQVHFSTTQVYKPGSVIDSHLSKPAIARRFQPPPRDGRANLLSLHGVAPDRVYIVKPISLWAGCALTAPFHPCLRILHP